MAILYVQFTDETQTIIDKMFSGPQDQEFYPYQGEVSDDDPRCIDFAQRTTAPPEPTDPVDKLRKFLAANPDVAALLAE